MTKRKLKHWLVSYLDYAGVMEAPKLMHFYAGVSAIAGALRRKVWIDQTRFKWFPSFYIVFVAPPGIVAKSTTADVAMDLLKQVPGIRFGPDVITWPALASAFAGANEAFQFGEDWMPMSPITLCASELGNLINPQDRDMVNLYISLWDGRNSFEKVTKGSGSDTISAPWINMLGCTTPHWIADNMPSATVGGGFTSRCIFVYVDEKEKFVPYIDEVIPKTDSDMRIDLIHDLEHIATNLVGPYTLVEEARVWGREWYETLWKTRSASLEDDRLDGYIARKQTHLHKLSMVIAAAQRDDMVILAEDLIIADQMLLSIETDLDKVFSRIGRTEDSLQVERFLQFIQRKGAVGSPYAVALRYVHSYFPDFRDFEGIIAGAIRAGLIRIGTKGGEAWIYFIGPEKVNGHPAKMNGHDIGGEH